MRHQVKKIKFSLGRDANRMLMRKLASNFFKNNKIETTLEKAKSLKSYLENLIGKAKENNEANKNHLLKYLGNIEVVEMMFKDIGPKLKDKMGGYIRIIKLGARFSDGAEVARLEWTLPIVVEKKTEIKKEKVEKIKNKNG